jgi:RHS repeat-associated protein
MALDKPGLDRRHSRPGTRPALDLAVLWPWGEGRYTEGATPTEFHFTGQKELSVLGLHFYGARWYDSALGRFIQADSVVPLESQGVQAWDRYAYVNNNPVRYTDPAGHDVGCAGRDASACEYDVPLWKRSAASLEFRAKRELLVGKRDNRLSETILSSDSPISRGIYFEWAAGNVIKSVLCGGENLGQSATDLALIGLTNFSTGLLGLGMGGDVSPVLGSGNAYSVAFETVLPAGTYPGSGRSIHFKYANQALLEAMDSDSAFAAGMNQLIPNLAEHISSRVSTSPSGWTWHHHPLELGLMQLVPRIQHESPLLRYLFLDENGRGGFANWGK